MKSKSFFLITIILLLSMFLSGLQLRAQTQEPEPKNPDTPLINAMHMISSHDLMAYVEKLCSPEFGGRLTGTEFYNKSAQWTANLLKQWDVKPIGDDGTFFQHFPNPYTLVKESGSLILHIPVKKKSTVEKHYLYQTDYLPGSTSGSGKVKAEVIYVGYGVTAPELGYDDYKGLNVKGKIVMMEREVPINPDKEPELFKKWRSYSFHQYKVKNAKDHGAAGMLYIYHIANPNCLYIPDLILSYVGQTVVDDLFAGTGKTHKEVKEAIANQRKPQSFKTGKTVTISNVTEHHPEGIGINVIGMIEGSDPELKNEAVMLSGHLDHLGFNHEMMPGANDNASAVAVILGVARAIHLGKLKPKRSIIFNFFGAEEQGVAGSKYYLEHPVFPNEKLFALLNLDGVGRGTKIKGIAGKEYPQLWKYVEDANNRYIHREIIATPFGNIARPRLDAARFMWKGVPSLSFSAEGGAKLPYNYYHKTLDNPSIITPEIMEDMAQLLLITTLRMTGFGE